MIFNEAFDILYDIRKVFAAKAAEVDLMVSTSITIQNSVGLHARPATFFVQKANSYKCSIWVEKDDCRVNAKSLLGVLSLGIAKGMTVTLIADGQDEALAVEGLANLVNNEIAEY